MDKIRYCLILCVFMMVVCALALVVIGVLFYFFVMGLSLEEAEAIAYFLAHVAGIAAAGTIAIYCYDYWLFHWW